MFKNKKVVIGLVAVLIIALFGGTYYFLFGQTKKDASPVETSDEMIQTLTAEELGLTMEISPDNKKVKFLIEKASDITSIEYQITYEADSTSQEQSEGGEPRVQRGITGEAEVDGGSSYESEWLDLGSCSRNVCRYYR